MGLFSGLKKELLKVIEWTDDSTTTIVYRYPMNDRHEIMNGCQLVVRESQTAILVHEGQVGDVYGPGTHKLTTNNMPIITKLASWKYGFDSPFKAEVYYVNTKQFINLKWGTATRVTMRDHDFGVIRVGARGSYTFKVSDALLFMREIFGTNREYSTNSLMEYFKSVIVTGFTTSLGEAKIPALDLPASLDELAVEIKGACKETFDNMGIQIVNLNVESVSLPEDVEKAVDQRSSVGVLSGVMGEFTQYQTAQAIRDAANNPGNGAAGTGVGLGAGMALGQAMMQSMTQQNNQQTNNQQQNNQQAAAQGVIKCANCHEELPENAKFCLNCGTKVVKDIFCMECGTKNPSNAKFCVNCGNKF